MVGDQVYLKLQHYKLPTVPNRKLGPLRAGPFVVKEVISSGLAVRLALPSMWKIHPVILVAELEPITTEEDEYVRPRRHPTRQEMPEEETVGIDILL